MPKLKLMPASSAGASASPSARASSTVPSAATASLSTRIHAIDSQYGKTTPIQVSG